MGSKLKAAIILTAIVFAFSGCDKTEGKGGAATIEGKVLIQDYTITGSPNGTPQPALNEKVYIVYGNGTTYSDDFNTSFDGSYKFTNLKKGTYKIFVYSDIVPEPADPPKEEAIIETVTISDKKGTVSVPTITVKKF
ncbi:MAG TPA: hypothetical protein VK177_06650 [Flavobacteriales bacterium]|nr:hypothetical protein [Flavobacteriales bacterium]